MAAHSNSKFDEGFRQ